MLSDPIILVPVDLEPTNITGADPGHSLALVPSGSTGSTKRTGVTSGGDIETLTISRSESKENAPYVTNRIVQRLDLTKVDSLGKKVTLSCYVVIAAPLSTDFPTDIIEGHVRRACLFATFGSMEAGGNLNMSLANLHITRVLAGEA